MKHTIKFRMGSTEYRSDKEIEHVLEKVRKMWSNHNYLNLAHLINGLAVRKNIPVKNLSDTVMINAIDAEINETD